MSPFVDKAMAAMATVAALLAATSLVVPMPAEAQRSAGQPIDRVIAVVNQEAITAREVENRVTVLQNQLREQGRTPPSQESLMRQVLEQMITARAQAQYAKEVGVLPSPVEMDRAVAEVAQQNNMSVQQLREREAVGKVSISEAEVDAQVAKLGGAAKAAYEIAQILLRLPSDPDQQTVQAKTALAEELVRKAAAGADFADLAREHSQAPEALRGGSLGWRTADRLPELFVGAVANLQPGQVAPVVKSPAGLHLLKLVDKRSQTPQSGSQVERIRARHILLPAATPAEEQEAQRRLLEFKRTIQSGGASFESLARQFSTDGSASKGGDLGWIYPGETVPDFERAMRRLPVGEVSEPVKSQFGMHLIEVLDRRAAENSPEQVRAAARQALRQQKADEAFEQWARELRDRAYVEYRLEQP